jgi:hypothetical protein
MVQLTRTRVRVKPEDRLMTTMTRHHITVLPRQGAYSARCEYEVDGEVQLCNIGLGHFPTSAAAREACQQGCPEAAAR